MLSHWLTEAGLSAEETAPALEGEDPRRHLHRRWRLLRAVDGDSPEGARPLRRYRDRREGRMRQRRKRPQRRLRPELVGQVRLALQVLPLGRGGPPRPRLRRCRRRDRPLLRRSRDRRALSRRRLAVGGIQRAAGRLLECVGGYAGASSAAPVRALGTGDGQAPLRHRPSHRRRLRADRRQRATGPA